MRALTLILLLVTAIYAADPQYFRGVLVANDANYEEIIYNPQAKYSFINYYATDCSHCNKLGPHIEMLAEIYNNSQVQIVQLEGKKNKRVRKLENIVGFPTMRLFGFDGTHIDSFNGERTVEQLARFIEAHTGVRPKWPESKVIDINNSKDFKKLIKGKDDVIAVFVAPWLEEWNGRLTQYDKVASNYHNEGKKLRFARIDVSNEDNADIVSDFRVMAHPTLLYYSKGQFRILENEDNLNMKKIDTFIKDDTIGNHYKSLKELHAEKAELDDDVDAVKKEYGFNKDTGRQGVVSDDDDEKYLKLRDL